MLKIKNKLKNTSALPPTEGGASSESTRSASPPPASDTAYSDMYDGVLYSAIARKWLENEGIYGEPQHSKRNHTLYQMATEFRYICNFDEKWVCKVLRQVIDTHGFESTVHSAMNKARGSNIPIKLLRAIDQCKFEAETDDEELDCHETNPLPDRLPHIFRLVARKHYNQASAAIIASLPMVGALCTQLRSLYMDGINTTSPVFFSVITAPQAAGKGFTRGLDKQLTAPIRRHDQEQRIIIEEYDRELKKARNTKEQPVEPEVDIRGIPVKNSNTAFLKRMKQAHGLSLYSYGEEIDTLYKAQKSGAWSEKGDLIRYAFDGSTFGQDYVSENSYSGECEARWNMCLCGTYGAVYRFFSNVEDGMMTRFCFTELKDNRGKKLIRRKAPSAALETSIDNEVERLYSLYSGTEVISINIPKVERALSAWEDEKINIYLENPDNEAIDVLRRRAMLMGFRAGMLAYATEGLKETKAVIDFAVWVAEEVLQQQMSLFGEALNQSIHDDNIMREKAHKMVRKMPTFDILSRLPETFTLDELNQVRIAMGQKGHSRTAISRWRANNIIEDVPDQRNTYRKIC